MVVNIDLSGVHKLIPKKFHEVLYDEHRYSVCKGSAGSAKSHSICQIILFNILKDFNKKDKHKCLILRKTVPAARRSVYVLFLHYIEKWGLSKLVSVNKTDMSMTFINGSTILFGGLDDPEKIKSIEGLTSIWLEEANEFTLQDFRQLDLRLRGKSEISFKIYISFNPISRSSWIYNEFYVNVKENALLHHSTYKDNPYLDIEYCQQLEGLIKQDKVYHAVYALGEWGSLSNIIFSNWRSIDVIPKENILEHCYGIDFGFSHPTAVMWVGNNEDGLYLDEKLYRSGLTNPDLIKWMKDNIPLDARIYADSAEPQRVESIRRSGYSLCTGVKKGPGSVVAGIDYLRSRNLYVTKGSIGLLKELEGYKYKTDKNGIVLEEPIPFLDDAIDSARYGASHFNMQKRLPDKLFY